MLGNEDATQTLLEWKIVGSKEEALKLNLTLRSPSASLSVVQLPLPELLSNYTVASSRRSDLLRFPRPQMQSSS